MGGSSGTSVVGLFHPSMETHCILSRTAPHFSSPSKTAPQTYESDFSLLLHLTIHLYPSKSPLSIDSDNKHQMPLNEHKRFSIAPVKAQDVRRLVDIEFHAFENERVNQVLSYRDYKKPAHFERTVETYETALNVDTFASRRNEQRIQHQEDAAVETRPPNPRVTFKKVVDIETNEIISFAKFEIKAYSKDELRTPTDSGHDGEPRMNRDWFALNDRLRREYIGRTMHCCKLSLCGWQLSHI